MRLFEWCSREVPQSAAMFAFHGGKRVKYIGSKKLSLLFVLGILLSLGSCKKGATITTKSILSTKAVTTTASTGTLKLTVAEQMADDVVAALKASSNMTTEQAAVIRTGALAGLSSGSSLRLAAAANPNKLEECAPIIIQGAIKAMSDPATGLSGDDAKVAVAGTITGAVFKSLNNKMSLVSGDAKQNLAGDITKAALSSLDDGGVSAAAISTGIGQVMEQTVSNLDDAGYSSEELGAVFAVVTTKGMEGVKGAGIDSSSAGTALNVFLEKSVGALDEAGIPNDTMGTFIGPMMTTAVGSLDDFGFAGSQVGSVVDDLMQGAVGALDNAGFSGATAVKNVMDDCIQGAMKGMSGAGVGQEHFADTMESMMSGAIGSLDDIGIKDIASIQEVSGEMISKAVSFVDDFGVSDPTVIQKASLKLAEGTMAALGDFKSKGIISANDATNMAATVQKNGVAALKEQNDRFGFSDADGGGLAALFSEGIRQGLAEAKFSATEITGMADEIAQAGMDGLIAAAVPVDVATSAKALAETSINAWVNEMEIHCAEEKGTWHADGGWCEFPLAAPVAGAIGPSPEQEKDCFDIGGFIMFMPDGTFFCDSIGELAIKTEADCAAKGYWWVPDGKGGHFCETLASAGAAATGNICYNDTDTQAKCQVKAGCVWLSNFCEDSSKVTCGSMFTSATCTNTPGCMWNSASSYCENATIIECTGTTSSTCSAQPGCIWDNGCKPAALKDCSANTSDTTCSQAPGCGWDGSHCLNLQSLSCDDNTTEVSCQASTGCLWNAVDSQCINSSAISCDLQSTEPTCSSEPGCVWQNSACLNASNLDCASNNTSASCGGMTGCIWDSGQNFCKIAATVSCGAQVTDATCQTTPGCLWDQTGNICINSANISCEGMTQTVCSTEPGCIWDTPGSLCINSSLISCADNTTSTACSGAAGCSWNNNDNICMASANLDCSVNTTSPTCSSMTGCFWDNNNNHCANNTAVDCQSRGSSSCESDSACQWDTTNNACIQFTHDPCLAFTTQPTCPAAQQCAWDSATQQCQYEGQTCNDRLDQTTCENDPICNWHSYGGGGGSCHTDGPQFCALTYGDQTSCDLSPDCSWSSNTCNYSGPPDCYGHSTQTACENDPQDTYNMCFWQTDGGGGRCESDESLICSNYFDPANIANDVDACNAEPYCSESSGSCNYVGPATCGKITSEASCTAQSDCKWDSWDNSCRTKSFAHCAYLDQNYCDSMGSSCTWSGSSCDYTGPVSCDEELSQSSCEAHANSICQWDTSNSQCYSNGPNYCAHSFLDQQSCDQWGGSCAWNGTSCEYTGQVNCHTYDGDQAGCVADGGCYYKTHNNECSHNGYAQCANFDSNATECNNQYDCNHNGTTCDYQGIEICGLITDTSACNANSSCQWNTSSGGYCEHDFSYICPSLIENECNQYSGACNWNGSSCEMANHGGPSVDVTAITINPTSLVAGNPISVTFAATSSGSGIRLDLPGDACMRLENYTANYRQYLCAPTGSPMVNNGDGTYTLNGTLNAYAPGGTYYLSKLQVFEDGTDHGRYINIHSDTDTHYSGTDPNNIAVTPITVTASGVTADNTPPINPTVAPSVSCPSSDVSDANNPVVCYATLNIQDDPANASNIDPYIDHHNAWRFTSTNGHEFHVDGLSIDQGSNTYKIYFTLSRFYEQATYTLTYANMSDFAGNNLPVGLNYSSGTYYDSPFSSFIPPTFTITNAPDADVVAPTITTLTGFENASYSPNTQGKIIMNLSDTGNPNSSGLSNHSLQFEVEKVGGGYSITAWQNLQNTTASTFEFNFDIPSDAPTGSTYYLKKIGIYDNAHNYTEYTSDGSANFMDDNSNVTSLTAKTFTIP